MLRAIASVVALWIFAGMALADPVIGLWQTGPDDEKHAIVQISPCGDRFCGKVATVVDGYGYGDAPGWIARRTIFNMRAKGGGKYSGWVWRPSNDRIFSGRLILAGDRLKFQGCVIEGLICFGEPWRRVD